MSEEEPDVVAEVRDRSRISTCVALHAAEAHRQSALAAASRHEAEDQAFVDAISWFADDADDEDQE